MMDNVTTYGQIGTLTGVPLFLSDMLEDGVLVRTSPMPGAPQPSLILGTHPRSWAHEEAQRIVRSGLADVCRWIGYPTTPVHHEDVLARLGYPR